MIELNKIYNEDCLVGMKKIPDASVDCIICDLPYGVLNKQSEGGGWDSIIPFEPLWKEYLRIAKPCSDYSFLPGHVYRTAYDVAAEALEI